MHHCLCALSQMTVSFVLLVSGSKGHHPAALSVCACVCLCVGVPLASVALLSFSAAIWSTWNFFDLIDVPLLLVYDTPRLHASKERYCLFRAPPVRHEYVVCVGGCVLGLQNSLRPRRHPFLPFLMDTLFQKCFRARPAQRFDSSRGATATLAAIFTVSVALPPFLFVIQGGTVVPPFSFPITQTLLSRL